MDESKPRSIGKGFSALRTLIQTKDYLEYRSPGFAALRESLVRLLRFVLERQAALWKAAEAAHPSRRVAGSLMMPAKGRRSA